MENDRVEKAAIAVLMTLALIVVGVVGICGWAVIELINWITSK